VGESNDQNKFWRYSLFVWTSSLLMTLGVLLNQLFYAPEDSFKANVGGTLCFLNTDFNNKCEYKKIKF
jgi:hypothetical protein